MTLLSTNILFFGHVQTNPVTKTTYGYKEDMSIKYTRAVYTEMRTRMRKATLFRAKPTAEPTQRMKYTSVNASFGHTQVSGKNKLIK
jgi:hypothetical protein